MAAPADSVCVGIVVGAHGIKGAVRVKSFTAEPADVVAYGPLADEAGRHFAAELVGRLRGVVLVRLEGIEDRNAAEALQGTRLYVPRAALPPAGEEEWYHADLLGLEARLPDGAVLGRVVAVHDFGAGDSLEIARGHKAPVLVPFTRVAVPKVDKEGGFLIIVPPPGLLDEVEPPPGAAAKGAPGGGRSRARRRAPAKAGSA